MIGSFFKNRREDKQMDDLAEICQSFWYFVTYNCDIDLNNDRKAKSTNKKGMKAPCNRT